MTDSHQTKRALDNAPARAALPRAIEVATMKRHLRTADMTITTLAIRAAFERIGYQHNLTPSALLHALTAAGMVKISHSQTEGQRYSFPGAQSRMEAVRMAARNIACFELAELTKQEEQDERAVCSARRTPTGQGYLVTFV
ncbi:hypothetical protein B0G69_1193 [Paraburkholderia sp. RAU2J]|uniref:hypothetical protein n=1 Tax=Paraburkholderia sp. RAU2J TaxID=1938810 RepID=UPI000EB32AFF|nr:hypothetical protein [Paraburkholderia sp. RAU2J]RKT25477.1 hypothetical protein B0G69_1193 [Paraburkholderia sp. RAU2J]